MNKRRVFRQGSSITNWVLGLTTAHLAIGIVTHTFWLTTGNLAWLRYYFDYQGTILLVGFGVFEVILALGACRQFESDQPLHSAW